MFVNFGYGLNLFYSEKKNWAWHTTGQCPLQLWLLRHNPSCYVMLYIIEQITIFLKDFARVLHRQTVLIIENHGMYTKCGT